MTSVRLHLLALCLLALPAAGQTRVSIVQEAIARWNPNDHVYVIGDVGLQPAALSELESWLEGRHWTVLLVADASDQKFQDVGGVMRLGADAIEYGTGQGIARAAGFAAQIHPQTGEPDGAILSIVLAQRALYYTASKAQDDRSLGDAVFAGNLDRWAIAAMRSGGDIGSAVRNTVINVDSLLTAEIERPAQEARAAIESAATSVKTLEKDTAALRAAPSRPSGSLAQPDTRPLLEDLDRARSQVETNPAAAQALAVGVLNRVGLLREPIERYKLAAPILDGAWKQLGELRKRETAAATAEPLETARQALVEGRALYLNADPGYVERLDRARAALSLAQRTIEGAEQRAEAETLAHRFLWFLGVCTLVSLLWFLNRRRLGVKEEAEALLASWQTALDRKLEALFGELEQRVSRLVGSVSGEERRGYQGETEALAAAVRADVGSLTILWTCARAVLEQARGHIRPRRAAAILANLFLQGHYWKGIALLRDEPVPFDPAEGLPRLFSIEERERHEERGWREDLLGDLASYEPFRKSFTELMAEFHTRAERATRALDELETALTGLPPLLESVQKRLEQLGFQKSLLAEAGARDGNLLLPARLAEALSAAEAALEEARRTGDSDPVGAFRQSAARADRIMADALALASLAARLPEVKTGIEAGKLRIETARREIGSGLGLAPEALLHEPDQDPSARLAAAVGQTDAARTALNLGDAAAAGSALEQAEQLTAQAAALVELALQTFRTRESALEERRIETERLAALVPEHELLSAGLQEDFAPSALTLEAGGTVAADTGKVREGIEASRRDLNEASASLREGRILTAAGLLRQVGEHQEAAGRRMAEIAAKRDRLYRLRESNHGLLKGLVSRFDLSGRELDADQRITPETRGELRLATGWLGDAKAWIEAGREDPVQAEAKLLAAGAGLDRVEGELAPADRRRYEEAQAEQRRREEEREREERRDEERSRSTLGTFSSLGSASDSFSGSASGSASGDSSFGSDSGSGSSSWSDSSSGSGSSSYGSSGSGSGKSGW